MGGMRLDPKTGYYIDVDTGTLLVTKDQRALLESRVKVEKRGMLVVTTFNYSDIHLLEKRIAWFNHIGFHSDLDLLLVSDYDVDEESYQKVILAHAPFFKNVIHRKIVDPPLDFSWPNNVNTAFRKTVLILTKQYGEEFDWSPYHAWFNFESDVTLLKPDSLNSMVALYNSGKKPFAGYINHTKSGNRIINHVNGAAIYPAHLDQKANFYSPAMMLMEGVPWDVAGMGDLVIPMTTPLGKDIYSHAFGTRNYREENGKIVADQKFMDDTTHLKEVSIEGCLLHHGCKDGSLIDLLMGKTTPKTIQVPVLDQVEVETESSPKSLEESIISDYLNGLNWPQLISKYKISPKRLKQILEENN